MCSWRGRTSSLSKWTETLASVLLLRGRCWIWKVNCASTRLPGKAFILITMQSKVLSLGELLWVLPFPLLFMQVLLWPLLGVPETGRYLKQIGCSPTVPSGEPGGRSLCQSQWSDSLQSVDQWTLTQVHWLIFKISDRTKMFMAKSGTISEKQVTLAALLMIYLIWHLRIVVQVNILDTIIYFSCSGITSDCSSETKSQLCDRIWF